MKRERLALVRVQIDYSKYEPVVYYIDTTTFPDQNPYNLFRDNDPVGVIATKVEIRLLTDEEWDDFQKTGKVNNETVIGLGVVDNTSTDVGDSTDSDD